MSSGEGVSLPISSEQGAPTILLYATGNTPDALSLITTDEAALYGEEPTQLLESAVYEYCLSDVSLRLVSEADGSIVRQSRNPASFHCGTISPGLYTGRMSLLVRHADGRTRGSVSFEVRSRKLGYRADYRVMLEEIAERSVALLFDAREPSLVNLTPGLGNNLPTLLQRFYFLRGLLQSDKFINALNHVMTNPHTTWDEEPYRIHLGRRVKPSSRLAHALGTPGRRLTIPATHQLYKITPSLPARVLTTTQNQSVDSPENRFLKYALTSFAGFLRLMRSKIQELSLSDNAEATTAETHGRLYAQTATLEMHLERYLKAPWMSEVSPMSRLPLSSTVLQRRSGYREILQAWLSFELAAKLCWAGGEDVYGAGKRNVAALYEYWVFFRLLRYISDMFAPTSPMAHSLFEETPNGLALKLKSGKHVFIDTIHRAASRTLRVQFSYNRQFTGAQGILDSGSWSKNMRPDYTLSVWPESLSSEDAERLELLVHIHFDAKYRVDQLEILFGDDNINQLQEKAEQSEGRYRRGDLLRMHAYRDAIRRTQGAYIIFPGTRSQRWEEFHEILPGLGAFALTPGSDNHSIKLFILDVVNHLCDRASRRELLSYHTMMANEKPAPYHVAHFIPEVVTAKGHRHTPPAETQVLFGWVKNDAHLNWVRKSGLYNFRMDSRHGSLRLTPEVAGAQYLLLHTKSSIAIPGLLALRGNGPRVYSSETLVRNGYPFDTSGKYYLVFEVEPVAEYANTEWCLKELASRPQNRLSGAPYTISLDEVLSVASKSATQ